MKEIPNKFIIMYETDYGTDYLLSFEDCDSVFKKRNVIDEIIC